MQSTPTLSIIMPCYNYAHYLEEAVDSILQQEYLDYEILLIDDGSSDNTWQILQMYAHRYSHIHLLRHHTNKGIFQSALKGLQQARGTYLHFFACDDLYQPHSLSKMIDLFSKNQELGLLCADLAYFEQGESQMRTKKLLPHTTTAQLFTPQQLVSLFQKTDFWIPGTTSIIKRALVEKYGFFDPQLENISDWFYFHKIALLEGIGYVPETFVAMRQHEQTYTARVKRDKKRRRATYYHLLRLLNKDREMAQVFKQSRLLNPILRELGWKMRINPRYFRYL